MVQLKLRKWCNAIYKSIILLYYLRGEKMEYLKRITDKSISEYLRVMGGVYVEGPKWCGKSTSCKQLANTIFEFQDITKKEQYKNTLYTKRELMLNEKKPILFDEWQEIPEIWDIIRHDIDTHSARGYYLLTGSSTADLSKRMHSGIGRIAKVKMRLMSLYESGDSTGDVSLQDLFDNKLETSQNKSRIDDIARFITRSGFPGLIGLDEKSGTKILKSYYDMLINEDIINIDGKMRNPRTMNALLKSYARNISSYVSDATIMQDMNNEGIEISKHTFIDYKNTLEKLFIIENVEAWATSVRSKTAIRKSDKKELIDPALACIALNLNEKKLFQDFNTFGFLFESLCIRDLRIYAESIDGKLYHYREDKGYEVDAIIELDDGRWCAIEIKLGAVNETLDLAAKNLLKINDKINTENKGKPSFLMILYGGNLAYKRKDGVYVIPITSLKN
jgi:predicted AAA+ superfamily ATPase